MSGIDCSFDASGCLVCPEIPAVAPAPGYVKTTAVVGWNAGANSIQQLDGNLHTVFVVQAGDIGTVIGLKSTRMHQTVPDTLDFGLYFQSTNSSDMVQVVEHGVPKTSAVARASSDKFEIRRSGGIVSYLQNGTLLYTSAVKSTGPLVVSACMYASGDAVGGLS
ncbi:hypothetical protein [Dyella sp.]|uniref:hypothetical protein n=1 Tax=Dyella sp. TaxID=1869338 RepID=UPI002FD971AC